MTICIAFCLTACGDKCEHTYDNECDATCNECGEARVQQAHQWIDATCTSFKTCKNCGYTEGEMLPHNWEDATCVTAKTCKTCKTTEGSALGHSPCEDDGDCTTAITCAFCDYVFTEPKEHIYNTFFNTNDTAHWHYCSNEGCRAKKDYGEHYGEDDGDCTTAVLCDTCGWTYKEAMESHTLDESYTCTVCGITMDASVTVNGERTCFKKFYEAVNYAQTQEGSVVTLERNCILTIDFPVDVKDGKFTIDLNGKAIGGTNVSLYISGGDVTVIDSKGGGSAHNVQAQGGKLTIEGGTFDEILATKTATTYGTIIINGGSFSRVSANHENASLTIFGGSFGFVSCFNFQFTPDDFLASGCAYYDSEGNILDEYTLDSTIYRLSNVTVRKIAE